MQKRKRTELEQIQLDALIELSSIFDNYPATHELVGTIEVMNNAINQTMNETRAETAEEQMKRIGDKITAGTCTPEDVKWFDMMTR